MNTHAEQIVDQIARLSLFNLIELITIAGMSWCALAAISWPMLRRHAGTYVIFQVCIGFGVAIYFVSHAAHLLRFGFLSVLTIQLGLILVASLVGLALFLFFRAEDAAGWSWRGFFFAYVLPLVTVASSLPTARQLIQLLKKGSAVIGHPL